MAFQNDAEFEDDFRKVGADVTAGFDPASTQGDQAEHASSENLSAAAKPDVLEDDDEADEDDEDLDDDDDDLEDDDEEEDEDDEDEDLEDDDEEDEDEEDDEDLEDDEDDDELEADDDTVKARNTSTAAAAKRR